jgi:hypothetical protein
MEGCVSALNMCRVNELARTLGVEGKWMVNGDRRYEVPCLGGWRLLFVEAEEQRQERFCPAPRGVTAWKERPTLWWSCRMIHWPVWSRRGRRPPSSRCANVPWALVESFRRLREVKFWGNCKLMLSALQCRRRTFGVIVSSCEVWGAAGVNLLGNSRLKWSGLRRRRKFVG